MKHTNREAPFFFKISLIKTVVHKWMASLYKDLINKITKLTKIPLSKELYDQH